MGERGRGRLEGEEAGRMEARYREASASGLLGLLGSGAPVGARVDAAGCWGASFLNRAPLAFLDRTPKWSRGALEQDLEVGRMAGDFPAGCVYSALSFLWGDASSSLRLRAPGSRGWEPVRCACRADGASSMCESCCFQS